MKHRISAGVLLEHEGKVLLVRHCKPGAYDFWVAPGGGAEGVEDLRATAQREVLEECGLHVEPQAVAYIGAWKRCLRAGAARRRWAIDTTPRSIVSSCAYERWRHRPPSSRRWSP